MGQRQSKLKELVMDYTSEKYGCFGTEAPNSEARILCTHASSYQMACSQAWDGRTAQKH